MDGTRPPRAARRRADTTVEPRAGPAPTNKSYRSWYPPDTSRRQQEVPAASGSKQQKQGIAHLRGTETNEQTLPHKML